MAARTRQERDKDLEEAELEAELEKKKEEEEAEEGEGGEGEGDPENEEEDAPPVRKAAKVTKSVTAPKPDPTDAVTVLDQDEFLAQNSAEIAKAVAKALAPIVSAQAKLTAKVDALSKAFDTNAEVLDEVAERSAAIQKSFKQVDSIAKSLGVQSEATADKAKRTAASQNTTPTGTVDVLKKSDAPTTQDAGSDERLTGSALKDAKTLLNKAIDMRGELERDIPGMSTEVMYAIQTGTAKPEQVEALRKGLASVAG